MPSVHKHSFIVVLFFSLGLASCAAPKAIFSVDNEKKVAPAKVGFENQSENADRYEWDFGDGNTSTEEKPNHRYTSSGNYTVTLKAYKEKKAKSTTRSIQIAAPEICLVELTTPFGTMMIELYDDTPLHRDNFSKLVEEGYYENLLFHRVMNGFMIQGGDPQSKGAPANSRLGSGGPGYTVEKEIKAGRVHIKGALAAARQPDNVNPQKASSGSQFYIVHGRPVTDEMLDQMQIRSNITYTPDQRKAYLENGGYPPLDSEYTVFGRVVEGLDVIDKIAAVKTNRSDRPLEDVPMKIILIK